MAFVTESGGGSRRATMPPATTQPVMPMTTESASIQGRGHVSPRVRRASKPSTRTMTTSGTRKPPSWMTASSHGSGISRSPRLT